MPYDPAREAEIEQLRTDIASLEKAARSTRNSAAIEVTFTDERTRRFDLKSLREEMTWLRTRLTQLVRQQNDKSPWVLS